MFLLQMFVSIGLIVNSNVRFEVAYLGVYLDLIKFKNRNLDQMF